MQLRRRAPVGPGTPAAPWPGTWICGLRGRAGAQPGTREVAYHAIAFLGEWHDRPRVGHQTGLPPLERVSVCRGER